MDAANLRSLLEKALKLDTKLEIQPSLEATHSAVSNLASSPQDDSYQTAFASAFKALKLQIAKAEREFSPGEFDRLAEINSDAEFSKKLVLKIENIVNENPASPAVIRDEMADIISNRKTFIETTSELVSSLNYFGIEEFQNSIERGQIGFKIPRTIFDNNLNGLISELNFLRRFVRLVSEGVGESPDDIEVGSISTSDPLFWFEVAYVVAVHVGVVGNWALDTWKKVEEIRLLRAQTAAIPAFSPEEADQMFSPKIQHQIDLAIAEQVAKLSGLIADEGRRNEIENGFRPMLKDFLARVERGMTVEVRYLPPPIENENAPENVTFKQEVESKKLKMKEISSSLVFHRPAGDPVLQLTAANDETSESSKKPKK